jgi:acetyl-CoA carboxylase carboxyltransferase component
VAGPPVVARVEGEITKEDLGGAHIHGRNGVVDDVVDSEAEAFERTRRFLSFLPSSVHELAARCEPTDDPGRADDWLIGAVPRNPRQVYRIRPVIESVVDAGTFLEIGTGWGRAAVTGLARLDGWPVGVLSSDPYQAGGSWTADASDKVTRFVDLCDTFHLPVVHLVDQPGFMVGLEGERSGTIRHGVRAIAAIHQASVPWCSVLIRKVFGVGGAGHQSSSRLSYRYAWPSGQWGSLPVQGGIEAAFRAELEALPDEAARQARIAEITTRMAAVQSPFRTAEAFLVEEIIDPRQTRPLLCEFANLAAPLRTPGITARSYRP